MSAATALLLVVSVPPALLLLLTGNPTQVPDSLRSFDALSHQADDHTLLWILATVGWLAWLRLLACLILETLEQVRGATVRMPLPGLLFGADRMLASHLIAALLMTTHATDTAHLTPAPVPAGFATTTLTTDTPHPADRGLLPAALVTSSLAPPAPGREQARRPTKTPIECRVLPPQGRHHDTLWDIAERHLGDGMRWRDIFALNDGRVMPDGQRLTYASLIRPGWVLLLPADAKILTIDQVHTDHVETVTPAPTPVSTVDPHPTSPSGKAAQPDRSAGKHEAPPTRAPAQADTATTGPGAPAASSTAPTAPAVSRPVTGRADGAHASTSASASASGSAPASETAPNKQEPLPAVALATLGSLLLAASALLAALTRRRKLAARRRPPGVRATRPAPDVLDAERRLRLHAHRADDVSATIRLALLVAAKAEPPVRVRAVWEHQDGTLELVLTDHNALTPAPTPFEATPHGWQLTPEGQRYLFAVRVNGSRRQDRTARLEDLLQATADPFPVLLPVGARDGSACLVNLELLGLISLDAHHETTAAGTDHTADHRADVEAVLAAWAQALAGAPWAELTHLYLPTGWEHVATGLNQVSTVDLLDPNGAAAPRPHSPMNRSDHQSDRHSDAVTVATLEAARRATVEGADSVRVNVSLGFRAEQVPTWLPAAATDPRDPNVLLLAGPHPDAHRWQLNDDGTLDIPGIADSLTPLRLDPDEHKLQLRLLEHAEDPPHADPDDPQRVALLAECPPLAAQDPAHEATLPAPPKTTTAVIDLTDPAPSSPPPPESSPTEPAGPSGTDVTLDDTTEPTGIIHRTDETVDDPPDGEGANDKEAATPELDAAGPGDDQSVRTPEPVAESTNAPMEQPALPPGPVEVCVLGPLVVHGPAEDTPRKQALDVLVYLSMHRRPVPADVLFEAVWPNNAFNGRTLRNRVSEVRGYIAPGVDYTRGGYQLPDLVQTDWQRFQTLAKGEAASQMRALQLVRGRPFEGTTLDWIHLEGHFAEVEAAIVDLALQVGNRALRHQAYDVARDACYAGLRGCPYEERLYRIGMESAAARGATAELRELRRRLDLVLAEEVDDDIQPATRELYQRLHDEDELRRRRQERRA